MGSCNLVNHQNSLIGAGIGKNSLLKSECVAESCFWAYKRLVSATESL